MLFNRFLQSSRKYPNRPALFVAGQKYLYSELLRFSLRVCNALARASVADQQVAILGSRSVHVYSGILGVLANACGYVPLNPKFSAARIVKILQLSKVKVLLVCPEGESLLSEISEQLDSSVTVLKTADLIENKDEGFSEENCLNARVLALPDSIAYLLFTSGSTGEPKGVAISQASVSAYLNHLLSSFDFCEADKFSQMFDLTFDLSVHDMFVCWSVGAELCVLPASHLGFPTKFINEHALTVWFSVPSVVTNLMKMRMLAPGCLPSLRISLFCGEALTEDAALNWSLAANRSIIENLYGPTEATIAISSYRWDKYSHKKTSNGTVPIGRIFSEQEFKVVENELWLSGSQVIKKYFYCDANAEQDRFSIDDKDPKKSWYKTGDLVKVMDDHCLEYVGRIDSQIKLRGHRIELLEIDHIVRKVSNLPIVVSLGWPLGGFSYDSIYTFVEGSGNDLKFKQVLLEECKKLLPPYMVPKDIFFLPDLPLNDNGKIDRKALNKKLEELLNAK